MPFSNDKAEGFENKLAELIAPKLEHAAIYLVLRIRAGYVPNAVGSDACDLIMGYAQGTGLIEDSNPYYRTSYVLIYRERTPVLPASTVFRPAAEGEAHRSVRPHAAGEHPRFVWTCGEH